MGFTKLIHSEINWATVGAQHQINFLQNKSEFELNVMHAIGGSSSCLVIWVTYFVFIIVH